MNDYHEIQLCRKMICELRLDEFDTVNKGIWQSPMGAMDVAVCVPRASVREIKFLQEVAINGQLRRPNIVKLVTTGEPVSVIMLFACIKTLQLLHNVT